MLHHWDFEEEKKVTWVSRQGMVLQNNVLGQAFASEDVMFWFPAKYIMGIKSLIERAKTDLENSRCINTDISHTLLVQNHMGWYCFQNASFTGDVCDLHLRLTAKPHICMICDVFNTNVNRSLTLCSTHIYSLKGKKGLISYCFCIQVDHVRPCDRSGWHQHPWNLSSAHFYCLQSKMTGRCSLTLALFYYFGDLSSVK